MFHVLLCNPFLLGKIHAPLPLKLLIEFLCLVILVKQAKPEDVIGFLIEYEGAQVILRFC